MTAQAGDGVEVNVDEEKEDEGANIGAAQVSFTVLGSEENEKRP